MDFDSREKVKARAELASKKILQDIISAEADKGYSGFTVAPTDSSELYGIRRSFLYSTILENKKKLIKAGYKVAETVLKGEKSLTLLWGHKL